MADRPPPPSPSPNSSRQAQQVRNNGKQGGWWGSIVCCVVLFLFLSFFPFNEIHFPHILTSCAQSSEGVNPERNVNQIDGQTWMPWQFLGLYCIILPVRDTPCEDDTATAEV